MLQTIFLSSPAQISELIIMLLAAAALGILNSMIFTYKENVSKNLTLTLAIIPLVEAVIVFLVNGNLGTGIAVAGSFALVRFRSIPGNAKEISGIFIDMAMGIMLGMGYIGMAVIFFVVCTCLVMGFSMAGMTKEKNRKQVKITIPEELDYEGIFDDIFEKYTSSCELQRVKTKNMGTLYELVYIVEFKNNGIPREFIDELRSRNGNLNIIVGKVPDMRQL